MRPKLTLEVALRPEGRQVLEGVSEAFAALTRAIERWAELKQRRWKTDVPSAAPAEASGKGRRPLEFAVPAELVQAVGEISAALRRATDALDLLAELLQRPLEVVKNGGSSPLGVSGSPPRSTEEEDRLYRSSRVRQAPRPRSVASLKREVARLEVQLRRAESQKKRAHARCVIAGAPLPPAPPGIGKHHRQAWERAVQRHHAVADRLEAARAALAEAQAAPGIHPYPSESK